MGPSSRSSREATAASGLGAGSVGGGPPPSITITKRVQGGVEHDTSPQDALAMLRQTGPARLDLLRRAEAVRRASFGNEIDLCGIVPARRGGCSEDCAFCAQSARYAAGVGREPMMAPEVILRAAHEAEGTGASHFGIVTSGRDLGEADFRSVLAAIERVASETRLLPCASLGALTGPRARALVDAGCRRYNHNLETSERFFDRLCTTHRYADRLVTLGRARAAGLELCCGGIIGVGEDLEDRVALAFDLRDLAPEVIPVNALVPIPGTPLARAAPLDAMEVLAAVAVMRLVNPRAIIKVAGGRERVLGDLQALVFRAGANALIVGNYLTTAGRPAADDLAMIRDLGLRVAAPDPARTDESDDG